MPTTTPSNKLQARKFLRNDKCTSACSMGVSRLGDQALTVHGWFEAGHNNDKIVELAKGMGIHLSAGACGRHRRNHLVPVDDQSTEVGPMPKVNHIELLEQMIAMGARSMPVGRMSPEMTLRAMEMHHKLTQGSAMDNFMAAVTAVMSSEDEDDDEYLTAIEAAEAKRDAHEQAQGEVVGE